MQVVAAAEVVVLAGQVLALAARLPVRLGPVAQGVAVA